MLTNKIKIWLIKTKRNYRIPVSYGSDFIWINDFPEVYNAEKIIISLFSAPARRITVQRYNTTYSAMGNCMRHYMLCWRDVTLCGGRGRSVTWGNAGMNGIGENREREQKGRRCTTCILARDVTVPWQFDFTQEGCRLSIMTDLYAILPMININHNNDYAENHFR